MKTIGLIGGLSWESSREYYRIINEAAARRLGGMHSAKIVMYSFDFAEVETLQHQGQWDALTEQMVASAQSLRRAGADFLVICSNTMHRMAQAVETGSGLPLLHIADPTADRLLEAGIRTVGLLGTRFTMEQEFYRTRLEQRGLTVQIPDREDRAIIHAVIYDELVRGIIRKPSERQYQHIIQKLLANGSEGIILGCTEISLLIAPGSLNAPLFDTTELHALAALDWALA